MQMDAPQSPGYPAVCKRALGHLSRLLPSHHPLPSCVTLMRSLPPAPLQCSVLSLAAPQPLCPRGTPPLYSVPVVRQFASAGGWAVSRSLPWWLIVTLEALWLCVLLPPDLMAGAEHILQGCVSEDELTLEQAASTAFPVGLPPPLP